VPFEAGSLLSYANAPQNVQKYFSNVRNRRFVEGFGSSAVVQRRRGVLGTKGVGNGWGICRSWICRPSRNPTS
jgi:hypothetical protein